MISLFQRGIWLIYEWNSLITHSKYHCIDCSVVKLNFFPDKCVRGFPNYQSGLIVNEFLIRILMIVIRSLPKVEVKDEDDFCFLLLGLKRRD